jgi:hypothetical protein
MSERPTAEHGVRSLREHVFAKAREARARVGLPEGATPTFEAIRGLLEERTVVRYPLGIRFDASPLRRGEFACLEPLGSHPSDGFCLFIHPMFETVEELLPLLVAYYVPSVDYGDAATHVEAELYGSTLCAVEREEYYRLLRSATDSVAA